MTHQKRQFLYKLIGELIEERYMSQSWLANWKEFLNFWFQRAKCWVERRKKLVVVFICWIGFVISFLVFGFWPR